MTDDFKRRAIYIIAVSAAVIAGAILIWMTRVILLLLFAGLIGALVLTIATNWTQKKLRLRRNLALALVLLSLATCLGIGIWLRGPALVQQFSELLIDLPSATEKIRLSLQEHNWGRWLLSHFADQAQLSDGISYAATRIGGIVITTASTLVGLFIIAAVSLYVAAEPSTYLRGLQLLTPAVYRLKLDRCLESAAQMLRSWLVAKAFSMLTIGALVTVGLWALQVPMAGTIGIIAAAFTFIPNLGPVISFVPAGLLAFAISPTKGILTLLLFCMAHFLEGNIVTPLLERKIVTLPPALTLAVQLVLASTTGAIGVALAAPLTAVALGMLQVLIPSESQNKLHPTALQSPGRKQG